MINLLKYRKETLHIFLKYNMNLDRMIASSKQYYYDKNPLNIVCFKARVFKYNEKKDTFNLLWYGDLDINKDGYILKNIAKSLGETLYVVRYSNATKGMLDNKKVDVKRDNVWNTENEVPFISEDDLIRISLEQEKREYENFKEKNEYYQDIQRKNSEYDIIEPTTVNGKKIKKIININFERFKEYFIEYKKDLIHTLNKNNFDKYSLKLSFDTNKYFSQIYIEEMLKKELTEEEYNNNVKIASHHTLKRLEEYDFQILKLIEKNRTRDSVYHNYINRINIEDLNKDEINIESYGQNKIYILE